VVEHIVLVEADDHGQFRLVEDAQRIEHVGGEGVRVLASDGVCQVQVYCREGARKRLGDYLPTGRLREGLDLPWSVDDHVAAADEGDVGLLQIALLLLNELDDLVKLSCEDVQAGENGTVRSFKGQDFPHYLVCMFS